MPGVKSLSKIWHDSFYSSGNEFPSFKIVLFKVTDMEVLCPRKTKVRRIMTLAVTLKIMLGQVLITHLTRLYCPDCLMRRRRRKPHKTENLDAIPDLSFSLHFDSHGFESPVLGLVGH